MKKNNESNNQLPLIETFIRKLDSSGTCLQEEHITIRGNSLDECRKHYNELK